MVSREAAPDDITVARSEVAQPLGVYLSVPFCRAKCSFCNFASGVSTASAIGHYVSLLCEEIDAAPETAASLGAQLPRSVDTLYFGGGTPSLLAPAQLRAIFTALRRNFTISNTAEITLESAPGQIADDLLEAAMSLGVNRVSLGVQSFVDRESAAVGRTHTGRDCIREIARLQAAGLRDVGADLIAGLPYQTHTSWQHSLDIATGAGLTHLSVYMLEIDEDSRLGREVIAGGTRFHAHGVPQEDLAAELYERACEALPHAGFAQYEISNFALAHHQSRHNRKYWQRAPYIGFGLDAHSMLPCGKGALRFANPDELQHYAGAYSPRERTPVTPHEAFEEALFLGLRMNEGVCVSRLRAQFGHAAVQAVQPAVHELSAEALIQLAGGRWKLTLRGRLVSNDVFGRLLETNLAACVPSAPRSPKRNARMA